MTVSDASLAGVGVCQTSWPRACIEELGRVSERWRFRPGLPPPRPREAALGRLDPFLDPRSVKRLRDEPEVAQFVVNDEFSEVHSDLIDGSAWRLCFAWPARRAEHIGILESRDCERVPSQVAQHSVVW